MSNEVSKIPNKTLLNINAHTKAKHTILERYLKGWFTILSKFNRRIIYLDGFAGSGICDSGDFGSPVIAPRVAKEHVLSDAMLNLVVLDLSPQVTLISSFTDPIYWSISNCKFGVRPMVSD